VSADGKREPFDARPATASLGEAPEWRGPQAPKTLPTREGQEAQPSLGCEKCRQLDNERRDARNRGDHSAATDASVLIRRHPHH
jgi:hypothetical protein